MLLRLIVGAIIGSIGGAIVGRENKAGCIFNIIAGLAGSYIGEIVFGNWGPHIAGIALLPAILGAVIIVAVVSFITSR